MNKETHNKALEMIVLANVNNVNLATILNKTRQSIYLKKKLKNGCYFNAKDVKQLTDYINERKKLLNNI